MSHRWSWTWRLRIGAVLLLLSSLAIHAAFPRPAWAACGPLDMGACVDNAEYSFYYLIASIAWNVNRWLLLLAYQFDQLRGWLIDVAFTSAYQWLTAFIQPVYIPIATAALMLAAILFMLVPLTGETGFVNLRHVLIWTVLTPVVLTVAGQLIGQAEQVRSDVSAQLFTQMSGATPGSIFGSPGTDMPAPVALYPANPCGSTLSRRTTTGIAMDSLAAALMYADAGDIHCPDARGPSRDIPDGFYNEPPAYAYDGYVGDLDSSVERRGWVEGMQRGMNRLLQGIIPSFLAVLESLIHLVFSLSMAILWLSLPIGLIFVWFQQTASPVSALLRRAASILIVSWTSSMLMGFLSAALVAAAALGNAGAYTGMAFGGLFLMGYLCIVALTTLWKSIGTVEQTALSMAGMSLTQPLQTAAELTTTAALGVGSGMVSGGAAYLGIAAMGSAAFAQSRDASLGQRIAYTGSAMVGRLPGAGTVGEVAAAMGWLDTDSAIYEGLYAGDRSHHTWRSARIQMERDAVGWSADTAVAPPPSRPGRPGGSTTGGSVSIPGEQAGITTPPRASSEARSATTHAGAVVPPPAMTPADTALLPPSVITTPPSASSGASSTPTHAGAVVVPPPAMAPAATALPPPPVIGLPRIQPLIDAGDPVTRQAMRYDPAVGLSTSAPLSEAELTTRGARISPLNEVNIEGLLRSGYHAQLLADDHGAPRAVADWREPPVSGSPGAPSASSVQPVPLQRTDPHTAYAIARVGAAPNPATGADWQYTGSIRTANGYRHLFRHPAHPLTGRPETRWVESFDTQLTTAPTTPAGGHA